MNDREPRLRIALVHSPLTGPSFWSGVHDALWARKCAAHLARLPAAEHIHPPYWLTHAASVAAALPDDDPVVLVGHSGAGPLLPAIGRLARNRKHPPTIAGYVFVDCDLPRDGCSRLDLFDDPDAATALRDRSADGWMPRPTSEHLQSLLPDERTRSAFVAEAPRVPISLYEEPITVPDDWPEAPCAYVQLSDHYPGAVKTARHSDWLLADLPSHHLAPLCDPDRVADAIGRVSVAIAPSHL